MSGRNLLRAAVAATALIAFGALTVGALALSTAPRQASATTPRMTSGSDTPELTVATRGDGTGTVTSSPAGIDCGSACSHEFSAGTQVILTAKPAAGSYFMGWHGDCEAGDTARAKAYVPPTCTVTMDERRHVGAFFGKGSATYTLKVQRIGSGKGKVMSDPEGISCGSACAFAFPHGSEVTLSAKAAKGSVLKHWNGNCESGDTARAKAYVPPTCTITMDKPQHIQVVFLKTTGSGGHNHHGHHKHHGHKHGSHKHHGHKHHHHKH